MKRLAETVGTAQLLRLLEDWSTGDGALHVCLERTLRVLVASGEIPAGIRLPSERSLGNALNLSRNTVANAFDTLRGEGLFSSRQGDGTYVTSGASSSRRRGEDRLHSFIDDHAEASPSIDLRSAALPGLAMVADEFESFDYRMLRNLVKTHGYLPWGLPALRQSVAEYYTDAGMPTSLDQVLITSGAQQALRLAAASIASPGSTVLVEEPTFRGAIESLRTLGAHVVPIPDLDDPNFSLRTSSMISRFKPVLVVVQSTLNNPTGRVMSEPQKRRMATLASAAGVAMIDDATMADTVIDPKDSPPLSQFFPGLITVGSMSKSFWGGLRVGWIRADARTVAALASAKGVDDLGTSLLAQSVATSLLPRIAEARHARREVLLPARARMLEVLEQELPDWEAVVPAGGASLWVRLPRGSATAFAQHAERFGVKLLPGTIFSAADQLDDHIRVAFADDVELTVRALRILGPLWKTFA